VGADLGRRADALVAPPCFPPLCFRRVRRACPPLTVYGLLVLGSCSPGRPNYRTSSTSCLTGAADPVRRYAGGPGPATRGTAVLRLAATRCSALWYGAYLITVWGGGASSRSEDRSHAELPKCGDLASGSCAPLARPVRLIAARRGAATQGRSPSPARLPAFFREPVRVDGEWFECPCPGGAIPVAYPGLRPYGRASWPPPRDVRALLFQPAGAPD